MVVVLGVPLLTSTKFLVSMIHFWAQGWSMERIELMRSSRASRHLR